MRVLLFANNWAGWQIAAWLKKSQSSKIVGLVMHPSNNRKYGTEISQAAGVDAECIFDGSRLKDPAVVRSIKELQPDIGISVMFGYILKRSLLELFPFGCINVHPSFLPYNRGAYPNVWSIIENTPAGATIHYIDEGLDTGDIIVRRQLAVTPLETGESIYRKLEQLCVDLFRETWPLICAGQAARTPQDSAGSSHLTQDVAKIDEIDLDRTYTARDLINILRARTFPPYPSAYFRDGQRKVYIRVQLQYEQQGRVTNSANGSQKIEPL